MMIASQENVQTLLGDPESTLGSCMLQCPDSKIQSLEIESSYPEFVGSFTVVLLRRCHDSAESEVKSSVDVHIVSVYT